MIAFNDQDIDFHQEFLPGKARSPGGVRVTKMTDFPQVGTASRMPDEEWTLAIPAEYGLLAEKSVTNCPPWLPEDAETVGKECTPARKSVGRSFSVKAVTNAVGLRRAKPNRGRLQGGFPLTGGSISTLMSEQQEGGNEGQENCGSSHRLASEEALGASMGGATWRTGTFCSRWTTEWPP
jgi:hypothetical protein